MPQEWEMIRVDEVPLEKMRDVVAALANHLRLELKKSEQFYGETECKFVER